jgi:hypothetical protein
MVREQLAVVMAQVVKVSSGAEVLGAEFFVMLLRLCWSVVKSPELYGRAIQGHQ